MTYWKLLAVNIAIIYIFSYNVKSSQFKNPLSSAIWSFRRVYGEFLSVRACQLQSGQKHVYALSDKRCAPGACRGWSGMVSTAPMSDLHPLTARPWSGLNRRLCLLWDLISETDPQPRQWCKKRILPSVHPYVIPPLAIDLPLISFIIYT